MSEQRNVAQDMVNEAERAVQWLREEAAHRVPGHPATDRILTRAFAVEWLIADHAAVSAGCDQLHREQWLLRGLLAELTAALDGLEYARRLDPDIAHPLAEDRLAAALAAAKRGLEA